MKKIINIIDGILWVWLLWWFFTEPLGLFVLLLYFVLISLFRILKIVQDRETFWLKRNNEIYDLILYEFPKMFEEMGEEVEA